MLANDDLSFSQTPYESRYYRLINELRCLVCQNQTLADSNAELARDLRLKTHQLIESGESDDSIIRFMVDRYGDFILYRPPLRIRTIFSDFAFFVSTILSAIEPKPCTTPL